MLNRRRFLAAATGAAGSMAALASCARASDLLGLRSTVRVAVSWSGTELQAFRAVLDGLGVRDYGFDLIPLGDDIDAALGPANGRYGRRPDIVMLPRPGLVDAHYKKGNLKQLPRDIAWKYPSIWDRLRYPHGSDSQPYGLPFKIAHKSVVWYRKDVFDRLGEGPPNTFKDWIDLNDRLVHAGVPPLALGAADGWVLTDFFENVLLSIDNAVYQLLEEKHSAGTWEDDRVLQAFKMLGDMWARPRALAGGVEGALVMQFPDAVVDVFGYERAAMVVSADFAELVLKLFGLESDKVGVFRFPAADINPQDRPLLVGGDVAVLTKHASKEADDLLYRLARPSAPLRWIQDFGGFLAANPNTPADYYSKDRLAVLAQELNDELSGKHKRVAFDLSDQLGTEGGPDGLWRVLQDLLVGVTRNGVDVPTAAADASRAMREIAERVGKAGG